MPTASKAIAALCLAALGYLTSELIKALTVEEVNFGIFSQLNALLGFLVGWVVVGSRAGRGTKDAIGNGLTGMAALVFWALLAQSAYEMFRLSMRRRFDGPVEAFAAVFELGIEYGGILVNPMIISTLLIGALLTGYLAEYAARHWK